MKALTTRNGVQGAVVVGFLFPAILIFGVNPAAALPGPSIDEVPSGATKVPSLHTTHQQAEIDLKRSSTPRDRVDIAALADGVATRAKAAGAFVSASELQPVDLGDGVVAFENHLKMTHYESVAAAGAADRPLSISVQTAPIADAEPGAGLVLGRGPGSVGYGWLSSAELYFHWSGRAEGTLFTWKTKDRRVFDGNAGVYRDLWGYSKKAVVTPKDGWPSKDIVHKIYLSAWPTSSSKAKITGWHDYEPFANSGKCDTILDVGISAVTVSLRDCEGYTRWIKSKNGVNYGYGAMGVTYDQGFFASGGNRQAGLAMAVKVKTGATPYWNDRWDINMWQYDILGEKIADKTCRTYAYAGDVYCYG